jgi:aspartyl-tRNA(Asn)/glutamyl-tRNA(Gln) amidotransferase subunit B
MERAINYEIDRQAKLLDQGKLISQETLGWDEARGETYVQRSKEEAHDYRYFAEPDLPPLVVEDQWVEAIRNNLPELPRARYLRFQHDYQLLQQEARLLSTDKHIAAYFEAAVKSDTTIDSRVIASWITGALFAWMNTCGENIDQIKIKPSGLIELLRFVDQKEINQNTAKTVLEMMLQTGQTSKSIIKQQGYQQISNADKITFLINQVLQQNPTVLQDYIAGKESLFNWFFGQVMGAAKGQADPKILRRELKKQLDLRKQG